MSDVEARLAELEQKVGVLEDVQAIRRLHWAYGYPAVLAVMAAIVVAMIFWFKRRGWF